MTESSMPAPTDTDTGTATDGRVDYAFRDGIARIDFVRSGAHNALDAAFIGALSGVLDRLEAAEGLRAVLISAEGRSFTVGGDIREFAASDDLPGLLAPMVGQHNENIERLSRIDAPVVAAMQGGAGGGGLGLAWVADVVIAADDLRMATGFDKLGLSGDGGNSWFLPRLIGLRRAQELLIEGRALNATEAYEWGLVTRVVARDELAAEAERTVTRLASGPTRAYARMRTLLRESSRLSLADHLRAEHEGMVALAATADCREGVDAFAAKRAPEFGGR